jgi:hypothetical protein
VERDGADRAPSISPGATGRLSGRPFSLTGARLALSPPPTENNTMTLFLIVVVLLLVGIGIFVRREVFK